jgi:HK97 family phage major capsid protein
MPVLGGAIEVLDFVPDNIIIAGYPDLYLLAERAGSTLAASEHVRFIEDQTVFKATARYDGKPVIPAAFVVFGVNGATIATQLATVTFAQDTANAGE